MKKRLTAMLLLALCLCLGFAGAEQQPPAGKTEGSLDRYRLERLENTPIYLAGGAGLRYKPNGYEHVSLSLNGDENLTNLTVEYLSGPESLRAVILPLQDEWNDNKFCLTINGDGLTEAGDATFRLYAETETRWAEREITIQVRPYEGNPVETAKAYYEVPLETEIHTWDAVRSLYRSPAGYYGGAYAMKNGSIEHSDVKREDYEIVVYEGTFIAHQPGVYTLWTEMDVGLNASMILPVSILAGDVPYFLRAEADSVLPGDSAKIELIRVSEAAQAAEIHWSCEGGDASIDENGLLTVGDSAAGEITVRAGAEGMPEAQLTLRAAGYAGSLPRTEFSDETKRYLDELQSMTVYGQPEGWNSYDYFGLPVSLAGGEKAKTISIELIDGEDSAYSVSDYFHAVYFYYSNITFGGRDMKFVLIAEGAKHYAQETVTIRYGGTPALKLPAPPPRSVILPAGSSVTGADVTETEAPMTAALGVWSEKKKQVIFEQAKAQGKTGAGAFTLTDGVFTPLAEGSYEGVIAYRCGNLTYPQGIGVNLVFSDTLKKEDFALTLTADRAAAAAGQKIALTPVFANPDAVNKKAKNDGVTYTLTVNGEGAEGWCSIKDNTITVNKSLPGAAELLIRAESAYCPSELPQAELRIPLVPAAEALTAELTAETLYLADGMDTANIKAAAQPAEAIQTFSYSSSAPKVAAVDEDGTVHALSSGKAVITVKATDGSGRSAKVNVTVAAPVTGLTLESKSDTVSAGKSLTIKAVTEPEKPTDKTLEWSFDCPAEMEEYVTLKSGALTVKKGCPAGIVTVRARALGALPGADVAAELAVSVE